MRLQKYMAHSGVASRRKSEEIISEGRVSINGKVVTDPAFDVQKGDKVKVDGKNINVSLSYKYIMLNKPVGVVSTSQDEKNRVNVVDMIGADERLYPIGRLDIDTSGLIILTNDGELTNIMTHPKYRLEKKYIVTVLGTPNAKALKDLREGIFIDGRKTSKAKVKIIKNYESDSILEVVITEGRNRQIRKMFEAVGYPVKSLRRIEIGQIKIGGLLPGEFRELDQDERAFLESMKNAKK